MKGFEGESGLAAYYAARDREMNLILTIFYFIVETARRQETAGNFSLKKDLSMCFPRY